MKKKLILLALSAVLLLSGCNNEVPDPGNDDEITTAPGTTTVTTTTTEKNDVTTTVPKTEDQPSVPVTTVPPLTDEIPKTDGAPVTIPETEDVPVTAPETEDPSVTPPPASEDSPVVLDKGSEKELSTLLNKYPIVSAPNGVFESKTLTQLIESASGSFCESKKQSVTSVGSLTVSVPLLGNIFRQTLELSYLTDGTDYELTSKTTEGTQVTNDHQIYHDGWFYNTSTTTQSGVVSDTDNYKIAMNFAEFSENVLASTELTIEGIRNLSKLLESATNVKVGMMANGSCVILAKGFDFAPMMEELDPDGSVTQYVDENSFEKMEVAVLIGADGTIKDLYVNLPLSIKLEGISTTISVEMTASPSVPASVSIKVPADGKNYVERTIEEVYGDEDDFVFDWFN